MLGHFGDTACTTLIKQDGHVSYCHLLMGCLGAKNTNVAWYERCWSMLYGLSIVTEKELLYYCRNVKHCGATWVRNIDQHHSYSYQWLSMSIVKHPTSREQMNSEEVAVQWTFHLQLLLSFGTNGNDMVLCFLSCVLHTTAQKKKTTSRLLPSGSEATSMKTIFST